VSSSRRGASSSGCLLSLLILVAVLYYGVNIGEVYFRYYRLLDEMQTETRIASGLDDGTIRRRIQAAVEEIGLPEAAGSIWSSVASPHRARSSSKLSTANRCRCPSSITASPSTPEPRSRSEHRPEGPYARGRGELARHAGSGRFHQRCL